MKLEFEKLFNLLVNEKILKNIKKINLIILIVSLSYIYFIISNSPYNYLNFKFNLKFQEVFLLVIIYILMSVIWVNFASRQLKLSSVNALHVWSISNIGKYFPASIGLFTIRLGKISKAEDSKKLIFSLIEEQLLVPLISLPALIVSLIFINKSYYFVTLITLIILSYFIFFKLYFINKKVKKVSLLNSRYLYFAVIIFQIFLVNLIFYNFGINNFEQQATFYLISTYIGLFFIGIPMGIGIRESIFIFLFGNNYYLSQDLNLLIYIRFLYLVVDLLFGIFGIFLNLKKPKS